MSNVTDMSTFEKNSGASTARTGVRWTATDIERMMKKLAIDDYKISGESQTVSVANPNNLTRIFVHLSACEICKERRKLHLRRFSDRVTIEVDSWKFEASLQNELTAS